MSLILEALRKSEAERRRGASPDVAVELPPAPAARGRAVPAWVPPAIAAALALAMLAWWWSWRDAPAAVEATRAAPAGAPQAPAPAVVARNPPAPEAVAIAPAAGPPPAVAVVPPPPPDRALPPAPPAPAASLPTPAPGVADIDDSGLPPVRLSMHMWDPSPARRFVILDGQRMAEGERRGDLAIVAIERDGVVIERDGRQARVPLP